MSLLKERPDLAGSFAFYHSADGIGCLDTADREDLITELGYKLVGEEWPTNGVSKNKSTRFFNKFKRVAKAKGYRLTGEQWQ